MNRLITLLQQFESNDVFNPWTQPDELDLTREGPRERVERLRAHFNCQPALLLVGEAPGYQGCHFSGIPFTNEKLILQGSIPRVSSVFRLTTRERPWCEPSATIVWRNLHELGLAERAVLWNTFAWHPFKPGNRLSNRTPTRTELESGLPVLRAVLAHFEGIPVVPVGQIAARTLATVGIKALAPVRHPSMGGATEFRNGLDALRRSGALPRGGAN
jgi:uracil-DNA glycosylase